MSKPKPNRKAPPPRSWLRRLLLWAALFLFLAGGTVCVVYAIWASTFDLQAVKEMPSRSTVYDMDGKEYSRLQGENRIYVPLGEVSKNFIDALLAREDTRFYSHRGIDPLGIIRAILRNVTSGSAAQGASTLTQQLARNSFQSIGIKKNLHRKLLEAFISIRIEQRFTKEQILELYVNRIYFGSGVYGIEAASKTYFKKSAKDLSLSEAAMIAGIIRAPTYSSPILHPDRATRARDSVLDRMVSLKRITVAQAVTAKGAKLLISKRHPLQAQDNYVMDAVLRELNLHLTDDQRAQGGLKVYTTIDPVLQKSAEQAVEVQLRKVEAKPGYKHPTRAEFTDQQREEEAKTPYLQGAAVVIDHRHGAIRALVGGRDYAESKFNRALQGGRQVGSTFKPFVYAAAYRRGLLPGGYIDDGPIRTGEVKGAPNWTPDNSDGTYKGILRAEDGLIQSRNTMSVRVGQIAGLEEVAKLASQAGLGEIPRQPAVFLGTFEANLTAMTSAYTILPNGGVQRPSFIVERVDDAAGETLYQAPHETNPVLDPGVSWLVTSNLMKVMERGTASTAKSLGWTKPGAAAGKTGTTNDFKDAWFIGYTGSLTCGVWVGFDTPQTIVAKGYGSALALPVWVDIMADAPKRYPAEPLKPTVPLQHVAICASSNALATTGCERAGASYFIDLPASCVPKGECGKHSGSVLAGADTPRGKPAVEGGIFKSFKRFFGGK
ncbi:MAG TPA: PBP1A family penicillin-binding protein [Chthoniobacteraceae bacterium]|nr:PBP1A family penicillin-binding protein [Chthoniobacteraceae bacterium]